MLFNLFIENNSNTGMDDGIEKNTKDFPEPGTKWNIICANFLNSWKKILENDQKFDVQLEKIDNSHLINTDKEI